MKMAFQAQMNAAEIQHKERMAMIEVQGKIVKSETEAEQNHARFVQERNQDAVESAVRIANNANEAEAKKKEE